MVGDAEGAPRLSQCIARPPDGRDYPLVEHLVEVSRLAGALAQELGLEPDTVFLVRLAGLLHDAGKARAAWQLYIRNPQRKRGSVPHAFVGSALFFALAYRWYQGRGEPSKWEAKEAVDRQILQLAADIADHHGRLRNWEEEPPWAGAWHRPMSQEFDWPGLRKLLEEEMPELSPTLAEWKTPAHLASAVQKAYMQWRRLWYAQGSRLLAAGREGQEKALVLRVETSCLLAADRFSVAGLKDTSLSPRRAQEALSALRSYLAERKVQADTGADRAMAQVRHMLQEQALSAYRQSSGAPILQLATPTGTGKTLAALLVALEACAQGRCRRIVYVAPYLSVLSQAAADIHRATGLNVLEHHSLADPTDEEDTSDAERELLQMESWQGGLVATTFPQLFRALFPARAQHTIRLLALRQAFVILDEPQLVDVSSWPLLNALLEASADRLQTVVLLSSATMPPWQGKQEPYTLARAESTQVQDRYSVSIWTDALDSQALAKVAIRFVSECRYVAIILNTIRDAVDVYKALVDHPSFLGHVVVLHGAMTPLHKAWILQRVREALLNRNSPDSLVVVATQAMEAGVDVDFPVVLRAWPILPSIVQAGGRCNRHGQPQPGRLVVFPYLRHTDQGEVDTRPMVYREVMAREETDAILSQLGSTVSEGDLRQACQVYFSRFMSRRPAVGVAQQISHALAGKWSLMADVQPYQEGAREFPIFVPLDDWTDASSRDVLGRLGFSSARELYDAYRTPGSLVRLSPAQRRRWTLAMQRFVVKASYRIASQVADFPDHRRIGILVDETAYSPHTGLGEVIHSPEEAIYL